jgi:hypothetical protein
MRNLSTCARDTLDHYCHQSIGFRLNETGCQEKFNLNRLFAAIEADSGFLKFLAHRLSDSVALFMLIWLVCLLSVVLVLNGLAMAFFTYLRRRGQPIYPLQMVVIGFDIAATTAGSVHLLVTEVLQLTLSQTLCYSDLVFTAVAVWMPLAAACVLGSLILQVRLTFIHSFV